MFRFSSRSDFPKISFPIASQKLSNLEEFQLSRSLRSEEVTSLFRSNSVVLARGASHRWKSHRRVSAHGHVSDFSHEYTSSLSPSLSFFLFLSLSWSRREADRARLFVCSWRDAPRRGRNQKAQKKYGTVARNAVYRVQKGER